MLRFRRMKTLQKFAVLSGQCGSEGGGLTSRRNEPQIENQAAKPISVLQLVAGGDPPSGADVSPLPTELAERAAQLASIVQQVRVLERKPARVITVAIANKTARTAWALLSHETVYRRAAV